MSWHAARVIPEKRISHPPAAVLFSGISKGIDMDFEKLTQHCIFARAAALKASDQTDDCGSANLDSTFLCLKKGERSAPYIRAIENAGLRAVPSRWLGRGIMITPPGSGQGNKRYASNRALMGHLSSCGVSVIAYQQMD